VEIQTFLKQMEILHQEVVHIQLKLLRLHQDMN
jgi:hypothetical protein